MARKDLTPTQSQVDQNEPTGWVNKADTSLAYNAATRTITLTAGPSGASFYSAAKRFTLAPNEVITAQHTSVTGTHFFYFNGSKTLQISTTAWDIGGPGCPTVAVFYNATTGEGMAIEERHGIVMDGITHKYLHNTEGTKVVSGFAMTGYTVSPATPANSDNDFDIATGILADEDLYTTVPALTAGTNAYRVWYRSGDGGAWQWDTTSQPYTSAATYMQYNAVSGSTWSKTELGNNRYVNMWVVATPSFTTGHGTLIVMGQVDHATLAAATNESFSSLALGTSPAWTEFAAIYRVTYRTSNTYVTTGKVRIEAVSRVVGTSATINQAAVQDHNSLSGLAGINVHPASSLYTSTTNFNGLLTSAETTVQAALDKLDDHDHSYSASNVLSKLLTVDGAGSSLDADLLDGQHASYFLDTSATTQSKTGSLAVGALETNYSELKSFSASLSTTDNIQIDSFNLTTHRSAQYFFQYTQASQVINTAVLVIHNGTDVALTEYGTIKLVSDLQVAIATDISGAFVRIFATSAQATAGSPVEIKFTRNLMKV